MKKVSRRSEAFLIVLLSFSFLVFPAYLNFSILDDSDMTPSYLVFGKADQEESLLNTERKEKILPFFIEHGLVAHFFLARILNHSDQLPALNSESLVLRC